MAKTSLFFYRNQNPLKCKTDEIDMEFSKLEESLKNIKNVGSISKSITCSELGIFNYYTKYYSLANCN